MQCVYRSQINACIIKYVQKQNHKVVKQKLTRFVKIILL